MTTGGGAPGERASSGAGDDLTHLLRRVAARDAAAFAALYKQTSAKLYGVVARILTRSDVAADVLQEVYVRVWEKAGEFDPVKGSAIAWMATIARNRALDEVRGAQLPLERVGDVALHDACQLVAKIGVEAHAAHRAVGVALHQAQHFERVY